MISDLQPPTVDATTATMTDRALAATADRALRTAVAMDRPVLAADDLVVAWQGDRGVFTNTRGGPRRRPGLGRARWRAWRASSPTTGRSCW